MSVDGDRNSIPRSDLLSDIDQLGSLSPFFHLLGYCCLPLSSPLSSTVRCVYPQPHPNALRILPFSHRLCNSACHLLPLLLFVASVSPQTLIITYNCRAMRVVSVTSRRPRCLCSDGCQTGSTTAWSRRRRFCGLYIFLVYVLFIAFTSTVCVCS